MKNIHVLMLQIRFLIQFTDKGPQKGTADRPVCKRCVTRIADGLCAIARLHVSDFLHIRPNPARVDGPIAALRLAIH